MAATAAFVGKKRMGVLLVDMDGTIANLDGELVRRLKERGKTGAALANLVVGRPDFEYESKLEVVAKPIMSEPGFFVSLAPIVGAVQAIKQLQTDGWEIFFCTSPLSNYEHCVPEKYKWIEIHFGREWTSRIIVTKDKTLVRGDYLIDDRPTAAIAARGVAKPIWYHILYDQSYNRTLDPTATATPRIKTWADLNTLNSLLVPLHSLAALCPPSK
jgi:5'-nucleotidase